MEEPKKINKKNKILAFVILPFYIILLLTLFNFLFTDNWEGVISLLGYYTGIYLIYLLYPILFTDIYEKVFYIDGDLSLFKKIKRNKFFFIVQTLLGIGLGILFSFSP
ncbi:MULTISPECIES: hypothetical protein [Bacillaceae]|uniref:Uncharacterized protein n=1 Tax=Evansella alkalicola TaxID=745819 RepID=A0ABS6JN29_9BACI|nr:MULTISPECIES: hypothetical protein [Bacillaceae]MBU9719963.1 hypothetical protein [Bacillus alkalicola]